MPKWVVLPRYGEFEIVGSREGQPRLLGEGGFGKTYEAVRDVKIAGKSIPETAALKVLNPNLLNSDAKVFQVIQELSALTKLDHANLIRYIQYGEEQGQVYYAMRLCRGGDLAGVVRRLGPLPERVAARIGMQVCAGLREVHGHRLVHRDIKPSNVMLVEEIKAEQGMEHLALRLEEQENLCRIVDFGLISYAQDSQGFIANAMRQPFAGSPMFASPEQIKEQPVDSRSDLYSVGMMLWYLVLGKGPLLGPKGDPLRDEGSVLDIHASPEEHTHRLPPFLSAEFRSLLSKFIAKKPERRFASAREAQTALREFLEAGASPVSNPSLSMVVNRTHLQIDDIYAINSTPLPPRFGMRGYLAYEKTSGMPVRLTIVQSKENYASPQQMQEYLQQLSSLANIASQPTFPDAVLRIVDVVDASDSLCCVEEAPLPITLADVLRIRGRSKAFSFREAAIVLEPIAEALAFLLQQGRERVSLPCEEIYLHSQQAQQNLDAKTLSLPLADWQELQVKFSMLWFSQSSGGFDAHFDPTATMSWASQVTSSGSGSASDSGSHPIRLFCRLVYRMMSGSEVAAAAEYTPHAYVPVVELSAASNNLLRDVLCGRLSPQSMDELFNDMCVHEALPRQTIVGQRSRSRSHSSPVPRPSYPSRPQEPSPTPAPAPTPAWSPAARQPQPQPPAWSPPPASPAGPPPLPGRQFSGPVPSSSSPTPQAQPQHYQTSAHTDTQYQEPPLHRPPERPPQHGPPVAEITGPGMAISPFDNRRREFRVAAEDWRPSGTVICPFTQRPFQLPDHLDPLSATVVSPGVVTSPYDPTAQEIQIGWDYWKPGAMLGCPYTGEPFVLPPDLPKGVGTLIPGQAHAVRSPYHERGVVSNVPPAQWTPGATLTCPVTRLEFLLPDNLGPVEALVVPNRPGELSSPYAPTVKWYIPPPEWTPGALVKCQITDNELVLPRDILRWPAPEAEIVDASQRQVTSPFAPGTVITVPPQLWRAGKRVDCPVTGRKVALPDNLPPLDGELVPGKIGVLRSPYSGKEVSVDIDQWHTGHKINCKESDSVFLVPAKRPSWTPLAKLMPEEPGKVYSPHAEDTVVTVPPLQWKAGEKITCPTTEKLFQLPGDLPLLRGLVSGDALGEVRSPFAPDRVIQIPLEDWTPGHKTACPATGQLFTLPPDLPEWLADGQWVLRQPGMVRSPYGKQDILPVAEADWHSGARVICPETQRAFHLPNTAELPPLALERAAVDQAYAEPDEDAAQAVKRLRTQHPKATTDQITAIWTRHQLSTAEERHAAQETATTLPEKPGYVRSPYGRQPEVAVTPQQWVQPGISLPCPETGRRFTLPADLPPLAAIALPARPGTLASPYREPGDDNHFPIPPDDWITGKAITCPYTQHPLSVPTDLPKWTPTAELHSSETGAVISPYGDKVTITVPGEQWLPGKILTCPQSSREYRLPEELPALPALQVQAGTVESPYVPGFRFRLQAAQWIPGEKVTCPRSRRPILLPQELPETDWPAEVVSPGVVHSPFGTQPEVQIPGHHWLPGEKYECPETKRTFVLPQDLPSLEAQLIPDALGKVHSPYVKEPLEVAVPIIDWLPGREITCPRTQRPFTLPAELPEWIGTAKLDEDHPGTVASPYREEVPIPVQPADWLPGQKLTCPSTRRPYRLPEELPALEARVIQPGKGMIVSPYDATETPQIIPADEWLPRQAIRCQKSGKPLQLPAKVADIPLEAATIPEKPGFVRSPYGKHAEISIPGAEWLAGGRAKCPTTGLTLALPASLPPLTGRLVERQSGKIYTPYRAEPSVVSVKQRQWKPGELITCPFTHREFQMPASLPAWEKKPVPWLWIIMGLLSVLGVALFFLSSGPKGQAAETSTSQQKEPPAPPAPPLGQLPPEVSSKLKAAGLEDAYAKASEEPLRQALNTLAELRPQVLATPTIETTARYAAALRKGSSHIPDSFFTEYAAARVREIAKIGTSKDGWSQLPAATNQAFQNYLIAVLRDSSPTSVEQQFKKLEGVAVDKERWMLRAMVDYIDLTALQIQDARVSLHRAAQANSAWARELLRTKYVATLADGVNATIVDPLNDKAVLTVPHDLWKPGQQIAYKEQARPDEQRWFRLPDSLPTPAPLAAPRLLLSGFSQDRTLLPPAPNGKKATLSVYWKGASQPITAEWDGQYLAVPLAKADLPQDGKSILVTLRIPGYTQISGSLATFKEGNFHLLSYPNREKGRLPVKVGPTGTNYRYVSARWLGPLDGESMAIPPAPNLRNFQGTDYPNVIDTAQLQTQLPTGKYELTLLGPMEPNRPGPPPVRWQESVTLTPQFSANAALILPTAPGY